MAKRSVRKQRRIEALNKHTPYDPGAGKCYAEECPETATKTVTIDGKRYRVCDAHAELVMIQEGRRTEHRRQQRAAADDAWEREIERTLGLR